MNTTTATYTHTGFRPKVGYQHTTKRRRHVDTSGQVHAFVFECGREPENRGEYKSVCGVVVEFRMYDEFGYDAPNIHAGQNWHLTCKDCRKLVGI